VKRGLAIILHTIQQSIPQPPLVEEGVVLKDILGIGRGFTVSNAISDKNLRIGCRFQVINMDRVGGRSHGTGVHDPQGHPRYREDEVVMVATPGQMAISVGLSSQAIHHAHRN
jgi:ADP-glucose pyrophosphorylase